jgi:hypothetical protein
MTMSIRRSRTSKSDSAKPRKARSEHYPEWENSQAVDLPDDNADTGVGPVSDTITRLTDDG